MRMIATCAIMSLALVGSAQDKSFQSASPDKPAARFQAYTKLVQVPVIVTDGSGKPVLNLTKDDFVLSEDGSQKTISTFESVSTSPNVASSSPPLPKGEYTNRPAGKKNPSSIIILAIDFINTPFMHDVQARRQLIKYLSEKVESGSLLSLLAITRFGVKPIHEYTTDPKVLIAALKKVLRDSGSLGEGGPVATSVGPVNQVAVDPADLTSVQREAEQLRTLLDDDVEFRGLQAAVNGDMTLNALQSIAMIYSGVPGRKSLIWAASSFPAYNVDPRATSSSDFGGHYLRTFEALNDANVAVYPLDARGLIGYTAAAVSNARNPGNTVSRRADPGLLNGLGDTALGNVNAYPDTIDSMKEIAEVTGGRAFYNTNDLAGSVRKAVEDSSHFYLLGYYLHGGPEVKPGRRKLKVDVKRPGLHVRSRTRVFVNPQYPDPQRDLAIAQRSPVEFTLLPMTVNFDESKRDSGAVPFMIKLGAGEIGLSEADNQINFAVLVEARSPEGTVLAQIRQMVQGKITKPAEFSQKPLLYENKLKAFDGPATVRFIVRDNITGKMGSVIVEAGKGH